MNFVWGEGTGPDFWHLSLNGASVGLVHVPWMEGHDDPTGFEVSGAITIEQFWEAVGKGPGLDDEVRNYLLSHKGKFREETYSDDLTTYSLAH